MIPLFSSAKMSHKDIYYCLKVHNACLQIHPPLMHLIPGTDIEPGFAIVNCSTKIEVEVDAIYKDMYNKQTTIDEVITLLQCSKASSDPRGPIQVLNKVYHVNSYIGRTFPAYMHSYMTRGDYYSSAAFYWHTLPLPPSLNVPLFCCLYETPCLPSMVTENLSCHNPYCMMYKQTLSMYLWRRMGIIC